MSSAQRKGQNTPWEPIAKKIRFLMHKESETIPQLAERLGIPAEHFRLVVDGVAKPTRHVLEKLCARFDVKLEFFGKDIQNTLSESSLGIRNPAPAPASSKANDDSFELEDFYSPSNEKKTSAPRKKRKFDLAELAIHHQALLECLIAKKILNPSVYQKKIEDVRSRAGL